MDNTESVQQDGSEIVDQRNVAERTRLPQYESPEIVDYGDLTELTRHQGDPHDTFPFHADHPHLSFSNE